MVFVATFESISKSGFVLGWWGMMSVPVALIVNISGWVIYRFRETRALTLAQFFEIRYSKSFASSRDSSVSWRAWRTLGSSRLWGRGFSRVFSVSLRRFPFTGGDSYAHSADGTPARITLMLTLSGGLITLMVTNCLEGMISMVIFLGIIGFLLMIFSWEQISHVLMAQPLGSRC